MKWEKVSDKELQKVRGGQDLIEYTFLVGLISTLGFEGIKNLVQTQFGQDGWGKLMHSLSEVGLVDDFNKVLHAS